MIRVAKILSIAFIFFLLTACYDEEEFPDVPRIEFRSLEFVDTPSFDSLILTFHFEDGDANLGTPENDFSAPYELFVDSEPKILTAANIDAAVPPIYLAPVVLESVIPIYSEGNSIAICAEPNPNCRDVNSVPAFFYTESEVYTNNVDDIVFECPNIINQQFPQTESIFDSLDIALYEYSDTVLSIYEQVFVQSIDSEVPALYREEYFNLIIAFDRMVNGEPVEIDFREEFNQVDCSVGNLNARIPFFDEDGKSGTITYNIISSLISLGIGDNDFRVRFYVYDRSGNKSNEVISPVFRISEITRN